MEQAVLTAVAAAAGFIGKSLWDLYWTRRSGIKALARQKRLEFLERRLSSFYWPVYLHLQKNNVVWEHLMDRAAPNSKIRSTVDEELRRAFFLPNHQAIVAIIESNIHLAQPDEQLEQLLFRFLRHVTLFKALRDAGIEDSHPLSVGEPWPRELLPAIEARLRELQRRYNQELQEAA